MSAASSVVQESKSEFVSGVMRVRSSGCANRDRALSPTIAFIAGISVEVGEPARAQQSHRYDPQTRWLMIPRAAGTSRKVRDSSASAEYWITTPRKLFS